MSPLFGPNIKKMKESNDIEGLIRELKNKDAGVRIKAVEALGELRHVQGLVEALKSDFPAIRWRAIEALKGIGDLEAMKHAAEALINMLKYGRFEDKIEAIARVCGHSNSLFLTALSFDEWLVKELEKVRTKIPLELVQNTLLDEATKEDSNQILRWYALVALIELGERSNNVLTELIKLSENLVTYFDQPAEESLSTLSKFLIEWAIQEDTLRALSFFRDNPIATASVISALEGSFLAGRSRGEPSLKYEFYALGALGDPTTHERLEYWAVHGDEKVQKRAKIALEFFGRATFDEIKAKAKVIGIED